MHEHDKEVIIKRYETRLKEYGSVPKALGWFKGRQCFRFYFLAQIDGVQPEDSILDLGCAFGELYPFMRSLGWHGEYMGVDIVPALIEEGRKRYSDLDLAVMDIQVKQPDRKFDWVFCSGALTSRTAEVDSYEHVKSMLGIMFNLCEKGVSVNFVSPYVDYQSEVNFHPKMSRIIEIIAELTRRFSLRHDYMPYEFTVYLYKELEISTEANIFKKHWDLYQRLRTD